MTAPVLDPLPAETAGPEFIELASKAGLQLDPWQQLVLNVALAENPATGLWRAYEVALIVSRQNGKGSIAEALELGWAFLLGEKVLHTSQLQSTSTDAYERILTLVDGAEFLKKRVAKVRRSADEFSITTTGGGYIRFGPRSGRLGRGVQYDKLMLDEALFLTVDELAAQLFTMGTRTNPQLWFMSSAGLLESVFLRSVRDRGRSGAERRMAYFEWSVREPEEGQVLALDDVELIAMSNPSLEAPRPAALSLESVLGEASTLASDPDKYYRERFGIFDEPKKAGRVITAAMWNAIADPDGQVIGAATFAADVTPERDGAAISVTGWREDDLPQMELIESRTGAGAEDLGWVVEFFKERRGAVVALAMNGPAGGLAGRLEGLGCRVVKVSDMELGRASTGLYDAVRMRAARHLGDDVLGASVDVGRKKDIGDGGWRWSRKESEAATEGANIAPLVSISLSLHALIRQPGERVYPGFRRSEHVIAVDDGVVTPELRRFWALKLGYLTPTVWQSWVQLPDGTLLLEHELYRSHARPEDLGTEVAALRLPRAQIMICDSPQDERRAFERAVGRTSREPLYPITDGVLAVERRLTEGRLLLSADALVGRDEELARAARPIRTADEVPGYVWDEEKEEPCDQGPGLDCARWVVAHVDLRTGGGLRVL